MRIKSCSMVAVGFSLLIGLGIALLFFFFHEAFTSISIAFIFAAVIALFSLGLIVFTAVVGLACKAEKGIKAICECGSCLATSAILTLIFVLVALTVSFYCVTTFTFILIFVISSSIALMFISLGCFISYLIKQNCPIICR